MLEVRGDILVAGNLVEDIVVRPVNHIEHGFSVWVESIEHHLGGNGANTSFALAKLGIPVSLCGAVGRDEFGDRILTRLRNVGVNLDRVDRLHSATATSVVLTAEDGTRSILHCPGVSKEVFAEPLAFDSAPGHFHLANIFSLPNLRRTGAESLKRAKAAGWTTSLDTGHDTRGEWFTVLEPCLPHIGILFANEAEAARISGAEDPRIAAKFFLERGVSIAAIKRGASGCAVFDGQKGLWVRGFPIKSIDTLGAGDCFTGGFLAALHRRLGLPDAAKFANACGALSASRMGSVSGLLGYEETVAWMG